MISNKERQMIELWRRIISTSLLLLSLFWLPGMCSAEMVQVDRQVLTQLRTELTVLQQNNEQLALNWEQSDQALATAEEQLTVSSNRIMTLEQQLITLEQKTKTAEQLSRTAENDLQNANLLLTEWKKEQDKEIAKIKQENKIYKLVLCGLVAKALIK